MMKILSKSTKDKVYAAWLKSELYRMKPHLSQNQLDLIENPNFDDPQETTQREDLMLNVFGRKPIMDHVPTNIEWHKVEIESGDIESMHILAIWDWFLDTGRTYKLSQIPSKLSSGHGHRISNFPPGAADHKSKIDEMEKVMGKDVQDIVMISTSHSGPFTIIDGTHRSSLLTLRGVLPGTKAYLGIARDLSNCVWAPEWTNYQASIDELSKLADAGYLW